MRLGKDAERLCRRPHGLTDAVGCGGRQFPRASGRRGLNRAGPIQRTPPVLLYFRRLLDVFTERLHGYERKLAKGGELKRVRECAGLSQRVVDEAEVFVRRFFEVVTGFPPEVVAVAVL